MDYYSPFIKVLSYVLENGKYKVKWNMSMAQNNINLFLSEINVPFIIKNNDDHLLYVDTNKNKIEISLEQLCCLIKYICDMVNIEEFNSLVNKYNVRLVEINNKLAIVEIVSEVYL